MAVAGQLPEEELLGDAGVQDCPGMPGMVKHPWRFPQ
jgi:hypothetical protein